MAQIVQNAPLDQPITTIEKPKHAWEQFNASGRVTKIWEYFFRFVQASINVAPQVIGTIALTVQAASIAATTIPVTFPALPNERMLPGLYRVSYYTRVTRAGSVSSSLTVSIRWIDGGVTITQAGAALTANTTSTYQQATFFVRVDSETEIRYLTTYADGGGATAMQYALDLSVEAIPVAA